MNAFQRVLATVVLAITAACASTGSADAGREHDAGTRYQVGDYVVYRYSGAFTPAPVSLREVVLEREGDRLVIEVTATRASEQRRWLQVVTDTPENQRNNVVDELYEVVGGSKIRLENRDNLDLYRLYEWVVLQPDGKAAEVTTRRGEFSVSGKTFACEVSAGKNSWRGKQVRFEMQECPTFLWTHGPGRFWVDDTGEDIMRVEVVEAGRKGSGDLRLNDAP